METERLVHQLRGLKRSVEMLHTEFAAQRVDEGLLAEIEAILENGLAADARTSELKNALDDLRESTLTPRTELHRDGVRACRRVKAMIEAMMAEVG